MLPWQIIMNQLIFASLSHTHYWYEVGMLKVPAVLRFVLVYIPGILFIWGHAHSCTVHCCCIICIYRGNYNYDLSLRPRKTQRVNSTTPRSRRFLKSFPIFSNRRHVFRRLCPIRGPFIALRQCRRRVNSTTPRSRFLSASTQFATVPEAFSRFLQRLPNLQQCRR